MLQDLHGCLLIHETAAGAGTNATLGHSAMSRNRGEPLVHEPHGDGGDPLGEYLDVPPDQLDCPPLLPRHLPGQAHHDLYSLPVPHDLDKLLDVRIMALIPCQGRDGHREDTAGVAGGDPDPHGADIDADANPDADTHLGPRS